MSKVSQQFAEGELVNVSIWGARVGEVLDRSIRLDYPNAIAMVLPFHHAITVERVAPAEWPPQTADIWEDGGGEEWFSRTSDLTDEIIMVRALDGYVDAADLVAASYGPMRLVRRRGWTPPTETTRAEPEQVDERAELVAGLRAAADLLEKRPDLYVASAHLQTYYLDHGDDVATRAAIERDAASLGVKLTERPHTTEDLVVISGVHRLSKNVEFVLHASVKPAVQPDEPATDDVPDDEETAPDAPSEACDDCEAKGVNCLAHGGLDLVYGKANHIDPLPRRPVLADVPPAPSVPLSADDEVLARALTALEGEQAGGAA